MSKVNYKTVQLAERVGARSSGNNAIERNDLWQRETSPLSLTLFCLSILGSKCTFIDIQDEKKSYRYADNNGASSYWGSIFRYERNGLILQ